MKRVFKMKIYFNPFGEVVLKVKKMDYSLGEGLRGKRTIDVDTHTTYFITTVKEIKEKAPEFAKKLGV